MTNDSAGTDDTAGTDDDPSLAARVGDLLRDADATVATAESCTGGLVGGRLTSVPGASDYYEQGVVTYAYGAKEQRLGVNRESLDAHGAVSEVVAREMAHGIRDTAGATWGVATTGVAGPGGGTVETPIGTVYVAVAYAAPWGTDDSYTTVKRYEFEGDREHIRERTVDAALEALEREITES